MARIAIDIDDTLYPFAELSRRVMSELADERDDARLRAAAYATWDEWRAPADLAGAGMWEEVVDICHTPENIVSQVPFIGAREALREMNDQGHELVYVSNRDPSTFGSTQAWLVTHAFPQAHNLLCHRENKLESVRDCEYLIDDRPKTLVGFVHDTGWPTTPRGRKAFGLVTPYNRALTDVPGIYLAPTWPLLAAYLKAKVSGSVRTN